MAVTGFKTITIHLTSDKYATIVPLQRTFLYTRYLQINLLSHFCTTKFIIIP